MKSTVLGALIVLNVVLLLSFVSRHLPDNAAIAQPRGAVASGDYLMMPMDVTGANAGIVAVVDQTNGLLGAITFDDSNQRFDNMAPLDLKQIFQPPAEAPRGRGR
jgi:hypothetical protein